MTGLKGEYSNATTKNPNKTALDNNDNPRTVSTKTTLTLIWIGSPHFHSAAILHLKPSENSK